MVFRDQGSQTRPSDSQGQGSQTRPSDSQRSRITRLGPVIVRVHRLGLRVVEEVRVHKTRNASSQKSIDRTNVNQMSNTLAKLLITV